MPLGLISTEGREWEPSYHVFQALTMAGSKPRQIGEKWRSNSACLTGGVVGNARCSCNFLQKGTLSELYDRHCDCARVALCSLQKPADMGCASSSFVHNHHVLCVSLVPSPRIEHAEMCRLLYSCFALFLPKPLQSYHTSLHYP